MKKMFVLLFVLAFVLVSCAPIQGSLAVQLPEELVLLISMAVLVGFTALAKYVADKFGIDIKDQSAKIAAAVSAVVVLFINYLLGLVPAAYDSWISALFAFLIVLFGGVGMFSLFHKKRE